MTIKTFVLVTGYSGAGKTTTIGVVREHLTSYLLTGDDAITQVARAQGFEDNLDYLNHVGMAEFLTASSSRLIEMIKEKDQQEPREGFIIDGMYDPDLRTRLQAQFPTAKVLLIHLSAPWEVRVKRVQSRFSWTLEYTEERLKLIDDLKHEAGVERMAEMADVRIVNPGQESDVLVAEIQQRILPLLHS